MGYTSAVGTMLMDEMAGICERAEGRFTSIRTDIGKVDLELGKASDWSARAQEEIYQVHADVIGLEVLVCRLEGNQRMMRLEMDEMTRNMNGLLELNRRMIQDVRATLTLSSQ